ncbi:MAG: hypothetical protein IH627_21330 [Rubrivivax sp.]|nr:hypothetical protein [Rubrivivax sp.]
MIPKLSLLIAAVSLALGCSSTAAQDATRLLPQSHANSVAIQWKQDGRVIDLTITNPPGNWVISLVALEVRFKPIKLPLTGTLKRDKTGQMVLTPPDPKAPAEEYWTEQEPEKPVLRVEIQPGKSAVSNFELKFSTDVSSVVVQEVRGREQSTFERLRSKIF